MDTWVVALRKDMSQEHLGSHMVVCQGRTNLRNKVEQFEIS